MEWFWIVAFTVGGVCLVGGIIWSILWRRRENKALMGALIVHAQEEDLEDARRSSVRVSRATEHASRDGKEPQDNSSSSCETLPSTSSKDVLIRNNNEMEMSTFPGKVTAPVSPPTESTLTTPQNTVDQDDLNGNRATPTDSDWPESSYPSGTTSPTIESDYTTSEMTISSRPQTASTDRADTVDSEAQSIPAVTFQDVPKRGSWKVHHKSLPQVAHNDTPGRDGPGLGNVKYERLEIENATETPGFRIEGTAGQGQDGQVFVPVQSSDSEEEYSTNF